MCACVCVRERETGPIRERRSIYRMNLLLEELEKGGGGGKSHIHGICCIDKAAHTFQALHTTQPVSLGYIFAFDIFLRNESLLPVWGHGHPVMVYYVIMTDHT